MNTIFYSTLKRIQINEHKNTVTFSISCQHAEPDVIEREGTDKETSLLLCTTMYSRFYWVPKYFLCFNLSSVATSARTLNQIFEMGHTIGNPDSFLSTNGIKRKMLCFLLMDSSLINTINIKNYENNNYIWKIDVNNLYCVI